MISSSVDGTVAIDGTVTEKIFSCYPSPFMLSWLGNGSSPSIASASAEPLVVTPLVAGLPRPRLVERFGAQLTVQNFGDFWMYQIGHCAEGLLQFHKTRAIKLADATDDLGGRCSGLHDGRGRSSLIV